MPDLALSGYAVAERDRILSTLFHWLRIPSISADPDHAVDVRASAELCASLLSEAGLEHVEVIDTPGLPAVYADWLHAGPEAPTVLVYGHHDVQPVDPLPEWTSPPFDPVIVDGECRARGAIDDKGQTLYQIEAARGLLATTGSLPVNLKLLVEGEEEVGSPHFEALLVGEADRLAADLIVVSDTGMIAPEVPSTTVGMRGLVAFDVRVRTADIDLHSGMWGGTVPNAARLAATLAASLHDGQGRVTLPGFYDRVRDLSPTEKASLAAQPFVESEFRTSAGRVPFLEGEVGYSPIERIGVRPTAEVVGIDGGYIGPGIKTIVPAVAGFKVAFRLVPDQTPAEVDTAFRTWLAGRVPAGVAVTVTAEGGVSPALTPVDHPAVGALSRVIERVWGSPPLFTREGGSGPEEALGRVLAAPVLFLGVGLPDDRIHAPNERMVMDQFWKGLIAAGELLVELGTRVSARPTDSKGDRKARRPAGRKRAKPVPADQPTGASIATTPDVAGGGRLDVGAPAFAAAPPTSREWVSFDDPDEERTWVFDATFLLSRWECIFGRGCQGVLTGPAEELAQGCCSYGAHFTDDDDVARVKAAARTLTDDEWQFARAGRRGGVVRTEPDGSLVTRMVQGACIFLNRPGFPTGPGCALHQAALTRGEAPLTLKPDVCWQLPLRREDSSDDAGRVVSTVTQWDRVHWGEGGQEFHWWCTEAPEAFGAPEPVYVTLSAELTALVGATVYGQIVAYLEARQYSGIPLPHPTVRGHRPDAPETSSHRP